MKNCIFFFTYFKKWNFHIYFTFITCKLRHLLLVLIPCFIKSRVNAAMYQEISERFLLPSAEKLYGDTDFIFQQEFSTCPLCQNHSQVVCWPWYYWASKHAWLEPHMEPMGYFQEKVEKQSIQQYRRAEGSIVPQADRFHATPHWCWHVCAKGAPTAYWMPKWTNFK